MAGRAGLLAHTRRVVIGGLLRGPAVAGQTLALKSALSANDSVHQSKMAPATGRGTGGPCPVALPEACQYSGLCSSGLCRREAGWIGLREVIDMTSEHI